MNNVDLLKEGTFIRFEAGRAVEGRKVFQRIYPAGLAGLAAMLTDMSLPQVGDAFDDLYPSLKMIDARMDVRGVDAAGQSQVLVDCEYAAQDPVHVQGGSSTASVLTTFDRNGDRIIVSHAGDEYIAQVEYEEPRSWLQVQLTQVFEGSQAESGIAAHIASTLNRVNADTFQGKAPRNWRVVSIDHELVRDWFAGVQKKAYRCTYRIESRPARQVELTPGGGLTTVPGWDQTVAYEADGAIPSDAVFTVVELYDELDFGGGGGVFSGVVF